jgi:hypothetical protein
MARRPYVPTASDLERRARIYCDKPGLYATKLVRGGVEVALKIVHEPTRDPLTGEALDRSWYWSVYVSGELYGEPTIHVPTRLYIGRAIDQAEYDFLVADRKWAADYAPSTPEAQPTQRASLESIPIPTF